MINGIYNYNARYKAFEVYIFGCNNDCSGCCNPLFKDFEYGEKLIRTKLNKGIQKYYNGIERIWVTGGEPCDIPHWELEALLRYFYTRFFGQRKRNLEVWLWTSRSLTTVRPNIKKWLTHIKTGKYDKTRIPIYIPEYDITLASDNQRIVKLR